MPAMVSKKLVIDADVLLGAGGEDATHSRAVRCRDVLKAVLTLCHKMVMTPEMTAEWGKKRTKKARGRRLQDFARKWLTRMNARKKIIKSNPSRNIALHNKAKKFVAKESDLEALLHDIHLIEAALTADRIVVSLDETARTLFRDAALNMGEIRSIAWLNPEKEAEEPIQWLTAGAPKEQTRLLGYQAWR